MSRPCKPVKRVEKGVQNESEKISLHSEASNLIVNEGKDEVFEIVSHSSIDKVVELETSSMIKIESRENVSGSEENREDPAEKKLIYSSFRVDGTRDNMSKTSNEMIQSNSFRVETSEAGIIEERFFEAQHEIAGSLSSPNGISTGSTEVVNDVAHVERKEVDDLEYIRKAVGPAIKKALAAVAVHKPTDPINYFANFLLNYRYNQRMFEKREGDLKTFLKNRENVNENCRDN